MSFSKAEFIRHVASLHDNKHDEAKASIAKLPKRFIALAGTLYVQLNSLSDTKKDLAISLHRLHKMTGASYQEIARVLEVATGQRFDRSYIFKLCRQGSNMEANPVLSGIVDTEKHNVLAKLPESVLKSAKKDGSSIVIKGHDVSSMSRRELEKAFEPKSETKTDGLTQSHLALEANIIDAAWVSDWLNLSTDVLAWVADRDANLSSDLSETLKRVAVLAVAKKVA